MREVKFEIGGEQVECEDMYNSIEILQFSDDLKHFLA